MYPYQQHSKTNSFIKSVSPMLGLFIMLWLPRSMYGQALVTSRMDGHTPSALTAGAPVGSYPLSDFESVNPYNGGLNFHLQLLRIGGRGSAGYTMMLPIERRWNVEHTFWPPPNPTCGSLCPWRNEQTVPIDFYMPVLVPVSEGYGPGKLELRVSGEGYTDCPPRTGLFWREILWKHTGTLH